MNKSEIRRKIIKKRNDMNYEERIIEDKSIYDNLVNMTVYKNAKSIFIYVSYGTEVDTKRIIENALAQGKEVYIPKTFIEKKEMVAVRIHSLSNLIVDKFGILEPKTVDKVGENFDLIIMPGVAFDRRGNRIGYGGGYYDKYLNRRKNDTFRVALSYEAQLMDKIEAEKHDINVDYIVTKEEIIKILKNY